MIGFEKVGGTNQSIHRPAVTNPQRISPAQEAMAVKRNKSILVQFLIHLVQHSPKHEKKE